MIYSIQYEHSGSQQGYPAIRAVGNLVVQTWQSSERAYLSEHLWKIRSSDLHSLEECCYGSSGAMDTLAGIVVLHLPIAREIAYFLF